MRRFDTSMVCHGLRGLVASHGRISPPRALADPLQLVPVDDRNVFDAIDRVDPHQPLRRQLDDHGADSMVFYGVAGTVSYTHLTLPTNREV